MIKYPDVPEETVVDDQTDTKGEKKLSPAIRHLDLEEAKKAFGGYLKTVEDMLTQARDLIINNEKTNIDATTLGTSAMTLYKRIIRQRDVTSSYIEAKNFVDKFEAFVAILTEGLYSTNKKKETIVSITKAKIANYTVVQESERRQQQKLADEATKKLQADLDKDAEKTKTVAPKVDPLIIPKKESTVRTESGAAYTKKTWTFTINDPEWHVKLIKQLIDFVFGSAVDVKEIYDLVKQLDELAPYLMINETRIRRAVLHDGIRKIGSLGDEGTAIYIYEKTDTAFRTT